MEATIRSLIDRITIWTHGLPTTTVVVHKLVVTTNTDSKQLTSDINKLLVTRSTNLLAWRQHIYRLLGT